MLRKRTSTSRSKAAKREAADSGDVHLRASTSQSTQDLLDRLALEERRISAAERFDPSFFDDDDYLAHGHGHGACDAPRCRDNIYCVSVSCGPLGPSRPLDESAMCCAPQLVGDTPRREYSYAASPSPNVSCF